MSFGVLRLFHREQHIADPVRGIGNLTAVLAGLLFVDAERTFGERQRFRVATQLALQPGEVAEHQRDLPMIRAQ